MPGAMLFLRAAPTYRSSRDIRRAVLQGSRSNHDHADELTTHPHRSPPRWRWSRLSPPHRRRSAQLPPSRTALQYSYSPIVKKATPAVVNVYVRSRVRTSVSPFANDPFFQRFFGGRGGFGLPQERIQSSLGSGVIISRRRRHRHQHARRQGRHRYADPRGAVRQARVRRRSSPRTSAPIWPC